MIPLYDSLPRGEDGMWNKDAQRLAETAAHLADEATYDRTDADRIVSAITGLTFAVLAVATIADEHADRAKTESADLLRLAEQVARP